MFFVCLLLLLISELCRVFTDWTQTSYHHQSELTKLTLVVNNKVTNLLRSDPPVRL